jgi:hypothetical protein
VVVVVELTHLVQQLHQEVQVAAEQVVIKLLLQLLEQQILEAAVVVVAMVQVLPMVQAAVQE